MTAVFSGTDWLAYVLLSLYVLAFGWCFDVCYFVFTLIVLVRLVLLPFM